MKTEISQARPVHMDVIEVYLASRTMVPGAALARPEDESCG